ncbi:hypothetical protein NQ318_017398 [Aromia moschata]|uniref:Uncharacterized protein n=1 Tax=Aromia moschata TaxID=1265417 RepID=A0AAV8Z2Y7_9CUCU|nr:hypothetical protein NQ318_017398 [Aromia moschata]
MTLWEKLNDAMKKNGDMSIDDKPRSGRPSTARNDENEISGLSWSSVQRILTEDLKRVAAKFPRALTDNQKECRVETCRALKQQLETDPDFLSKVITGDESWCYGYDPETKQQSSQWKRPLPPHEFEDTQNQTSPLALQSWRFDSRFVLECHNIVQELTRCNQDCTLVGRLVIMATRAMRGLMHWQRKAQKMGFVENYCAGGTESKSAKFRKI